MKYLSNQLFNLFVDFCVARAVERGVYRGVEGSLLHLVFVYWKFLETPFIEMFEWMLPFF